MGSAISLDVKNLPVAIQDFDNSPASRELWRRSANPSTFHVIPFPADQPPEEAFVTNDARAVLIIPERFGRDLARGANTPVQVLVDASDSNTARLIEGYAVGDHTSFNAGNGAAGNPAPVTAAIRYWYNPGLSSKKFYGPGIFVLALSLFPPMLATLAMAREGEQMTILQVYVSSISAHEFLVGQDPRICGGSAGRCASSADVAVHLLRT